MKIADRTFLISGGVSGLGLATARALHAQGAYVSLLDLNSENGAKIASELGSRVRFFETDVTDTSAIAAAVSGTVAWGAETGKHIGGVAISCYRGIRHQDGSPLRGQRTHTNARTCRKQIRK